MRFLILFFAMCVLAVSALGQDGKRKRQDSRTGAASSKSQTKEFKSDNCTWFPDGDYADCCVEHDKQYWVGGSLKERNAADKRLRRCVIGKGKGWGRKLLANLIYIGVRVGGVHFLPTPFRWGFGNRWPRMRPCRKVEPAPSY